MKFFLLITLLFFVNYYSYSQKNYYGGFYFNNNGNKVECKIKYFRGNASLFDKYPCFIKVILPNGEKEKLTPFHIESFKIESDSFTIAQDFVYYPITGTVLIDFVKVLQKGRITLYQHIYSGVTGSGMSADMNTYVVSKYKDQFVGVHNKKSFKREFIELINDDLKTLSFVEEMDKSGWEKYLPVIITMYNNSTSFMEPN